MRAVLRTFARVLRTKAPRLFACIAASSTRRRGLRTGFEANPCASVAQGSTVKVPVEPSVAFSVSQREVVAVSTVAK